MLCRSFIPQLASAGWQTIRNVKEVGFNLDPELL